MNRDQLPYRAGVGAVLFNRHARVFLGQRIDMIEDAWQLPQGGIDEGEAAEEAILRELEEEIGTRHVTLLAETKDWLTYELPHHLVGRAWGGKYRGQRQKWFAARFDGEDSEIDLATHHPEFKAWRWAKFDELESLAVSFKRPLYRRLTEEFGALAQSMAAGGD